MGRRIWPLVVAVMGLSLPVWAEDPVQSLERELANPVKLDMEPQNTSVYALPTPPTPNEGANTGGVNIDIKTSYFTDYIYRGVDVPRFVGDVTGLSSSESANFQFDGKLEFNLGKLPHPFIGIFANVLNSDPVSNFEEVRPVFGAEWRVRPLIMVAGNNTYVYPDRNHLNTGEVFGKITLDDAAVLRRPEPLLSPYIYLAYDYDNYRGWYFETGVSHDFPIEGTALTLTTVADIAYVHGNAFFALTPGGNDSGFQHYDLGLIARYTLNTLFNIPQRLGHWSLNGYLYYTNGLNENVRADTEVWGGAGIQFTY